MHVYDPYDDDYYQTVPIDSHQTAYISSGHYGHQYGGGSFSPSLCAIWCPVGDTQYVTAPTLVILGGICRTEWAETLQTQCTVALGVVQRDRGWGGGAWKGDLQCFWGGYDPYGGPPGHPPPPFCLAAPGVTHVIVREDPYRVSGDQMALGLLAGAATGAALGSFMWMPCWF